jgi:hypothetical protein
MKLTKKAATGEEAEEPPEPAEEEEARGAEEGEEAEEEGGEKKKKPTKPSNFYTEPKRLAVVVKYVRPFSLPLPSLSVCLLFPRLIGSAHACLLATCTSPLHTT